MITDKQAEDYLHKLVDTDEEAAELKVDVERQSYALKRVEAALYKTADGNIEERKAKAKTSEEYRAQEKTYFDAYLASEKMNNQRKSWVLILDVYRTQCANRRQG